MDEIARALKMDPLELRLKNCIKQGDIDRLAAEFGEKIPRVMHTCGLTECMQRGAEAIGWREKNTGNLAMAW